VADVNSNIGINFDTTAALASLRKLQAGLSTFNQSLTQGNVAAMNAQKGLNQVLMQSINATGKFVASQKEISTSTGSFTQALEKNQLSMREYFRYTAAAATANTKTFKGMFAQEREIINRARKDRVKLLQSQYIQLGNANGDLVKVLQVIPKHLQMANGKYTDYATRVQMAAQRQQFLNQLLKQGSTNLLNFGKNTQWAGRQLMVGLTIPLSILGSAAAKTFMEMEEAVLKFTRVYGDITTSGDATNKAVADIQRLGKEFTKYGIAVKDTMEMAATAAAMGMMGDALESQVVQATRLSVLGQVEQQQALETTISLQNAFGISSENLAQKINFLNAVENQTVLSIEDLTIAIPKAGPVVKQLGGDVEDLAFFMTAMKEGGINASEGANALKSGLASMINPAKKTSEFLADLGINIKGIVDNNAGNLKGTVVGVARALDTLDPLNRARAIEQLFGKFQFARISTLFQNIVKDGSQASRALDLAGASVEELAILSERELKKVEDSTGAKFKKAMENLKNELIPVGKAFLQAVTPIVEFVGKILAKFNGLSDGTKKVITIMIGVLGAIAPVALMTFGVLVNGIANVIKFFAMLRGGIAKLNGQNNVLGGGFDYLTNQQTELLAETNALHTSHQQLLSTFNVEKTAVDALALAYGNAASQARALAQSSPGLFNSVPGPAGAVAGLPKYAKGKKSDVVTVGGTGNQDSELALLTPGETVISAPMSDKYGVLINAMIDDKIPGYMASKRSQTAGQASTGVGFNVGGQMLSLPIKPESDRNIKAITNIVKAMETGALGVENGLDVVQEVFARFALDSEIDLKTFVAELRIATKSMREIELESDRINKVSGVVTGDKDKIAGHSRGEAEGPKRTLQQDMEAIGQGAEYERTQKIANETADHIDSLGLKPLQRPGGRKAKDGKPAVKGKNAQLDRGHVATLGPTVKSLEEGWARDFWDPQEHEENALSEMLVIDKNKETGEDVPNVVRERYMQALDAIKASAEQQAQSGDALVRAAAEKKIALTESIKQKVILNGTLNEEELQVQAEVLDDMLNDTAFMAKETTGKKGNKGTVATPGFKRTAEAAKKDAELRLKYPPTIPPDLRTPEERVASGMVGVTKRFGKRNEEGVDPSEGFVPLSDDERTRRLEQIAAPVVEVTEEDKAKAAKAGAEVGQAAITGAEGPDGVDKGSPSRKGKKIGKSVADGIVDGMQEGKPEVTSQASQLGNAAVPSAAETQAKVDKMDLGNKAFYDDIDTPEMRDERQVLKSLDRQRRKRGATGEVDSVSATPTESQASRLTASKTRVVKATEELAVETEKAVAAQSQIVEQIKDESKTRVKIKGNTVNINNNGETERVVNGTSDVADSTLLVADKTDELAGVTGDAVNAQTSNVDNLVTTGQLTDAANSNLGEMIPAMDQTGIAQQDLAASSANIAVVNDEIEIEKRDELARLKAYNAQQAAAQAAENGIVPPGSQSGNEELGKNRMGSVEAYEEASTYTRDKNGQIIFDPELDADGKKQPTTLSAKQVKEKKRGMRREKVGRASGKISGGLGTAAMVAGMAGAPPQVTAALGGAATVAQFAPMIAGLTGPQGIVVALAAVAAGAYLFNKHLNAMAGKAAQFAKDLSATRSGLKAIGEVTGKVGSSELMDKRRQSSQYTKYTDSVKIEDTFGKGFLGSEPGKKEKQLFQQNIKDFGKDKAVSDLALKLSTAVADGVLDSDQANSIAANLAMQLGDQSLEMQVVGQIRTLIGPDGKDLKDNPMETRINIMAKAQGRTDKLEKEISKKSGFGESSRKEVAALAALNMNNLELQSMMADQVQIEYETAKKKLETELASTSNAQKKLDIETQIATLNSENLKNSQFMNDQIFGQIIKNQMSFDKVYSGSVWGKQAMREDAFFDASRAQVESTYKGTDQEDASKKFLNKTESLVADTTTGKYNSNTNQYVKTGLDGQQGAQRFQAKMEMLVGSKILSPGQATSYMDLFTGKLNEMDFLLNAGIKTKGAAKTKELFDTFAGFSGKGRKVAQTIITDMIVNKKDPAEYDAMMETLRSMQALDGNTIDFEILVKTIGLEGVEMIKKQQAEIQKIREAAEKDKKTSLVDKDGNIDPQIAAIDANMAAAAESLKANQDRMAEFKKLSVAEQAQYLQALAAQIAYESNLTDAQREEEIRVIAIQQATGESLKAGFSTTSQYYRDLLDDKIIELRKLSGTELAVVKLNPKSYDGVDTKPGGDIPKGGGAKAADPLDFLDSLAMRIKNVRDGAFDATKPLKSMLAAFSNPKVKKDMSAAFKVFDGLQQRMIDMKVPKEFRDMISSMSAEDFKKLADLPKDKAIFNFKKKDKKGKALPRTKANIESLTPVGIKMMATYNEAIVGEGNVVNREVVEQIKNQETAFKILISEGATATEALEHVQDAALAAAIASGSLGKKGSRERKEYIEDLKKATDETERFALRQKMIQANEEFKLLEQMPKLGTAMKLAGFSADQMQEVLNDPALAKHLIEDLKDGKVDAKDIADYLNSIEARKMIDIQVNYNSGQFSESARPGMELVDEMFSVQEQMLRTGADPRTFDMVNEFRANEDQILALEEAAEPFRRKIELINREIRNMEQEIEKNYTTPIEEMQEEISDAQRELEMNEIFGDRAMEEINKKNAKMSNDSAIMANQAEKINEEYDKQAEALEKVAQINEEITNQQKSQLDIAGALTSGDIAAAARAAQEARAQSAQRFGTATADALQQSRENEIKNLRGKETGLTQKEIDEEQFKNSQELYKMETHPDRVKIVNEIRRLEDEIYKKEELREKKLAEIKKKQDDILKIQKEQIEPREDEIADLQFINDQIQKKIDKYVKGIEVLGKTQLEWDAVKAKIDANALAGKEFDGVLGALLASTEAIDDKWQSILDKLAEYNSTPQGVLDSQAQVDGSAEAYAEFDSSVEALSTAEEAMWAAEDALNAAYDSGQWAKFAELQRALEAAKAKVAAAQESYDAASEKIIGSTENTNTGGGGGGGDMLMMSKGGMVKPNYFAMGGFAKGTDTVPAMLTPGEFIMSKYAVDTHGVNTLKSMNNGKSTGGAVYNNTYTLTVNAKTDANPNEIAQAVMSTIKNVEGRRVRGVSLNG
jgi:TP901 family phage tail tape measure protein